MIFVDGKNLAIRYGESLRSREIAVPNGVWLERDTFVWSEALMRECQFEGLGRVYYYTSVRGDQDAIDRLTDDMKQRHIAAPRVFKRTRTRGSKRVDVSLATDMLTHAFRKNYTMAILVAGDEDYVPLVQAVQSHGCLVVLWFVEDGLSPALRRTADHYSNLSWALP